ncbi:MAG: helix-turn-helix domain-containing protein [Candidatus Accumulibacter propinquus]|jgi:hypothetical protein|uniref:helix-turn-helix domain-containing protein n=1 Tax=Candidatus Accumulibacter propinquus TaxID=2954380 RepID=UPI002FC39F68
MTTFERISPEESLKIQALRAAGSSIDDIAVELNRSGNGIWLHLRRLAGLPTKTGKVRAKPLAPAVSPPPPTAVSVAAPPVAKRRKSRGLAKHQAGEVKCLGGCGKIFASPDRLRIRICPVCKHRHRQDALPTNYALHL